MTDLSHGYCKGEREYLFFSDTRVLRLGFLSSLGLCFSIAVCYSNIKIQFSFTCVKHSFPSLTRRKSTLLPPNGANKIVYTHTFFFFFKPSLLSLYQCICKNNSCLPTSWLRFYPLITSSLFDIFIGVPEFPVLGQFLWISPVLLDPSSCPHLLSLSSSALPQAPYAHQFVIS